MSLQVWLPLNGNTNNQGCSNLILNGQPNSWESGKIGKSAKFNGGNINIIYNNTSDLNYTDNFSWCGWFLTNYASGSTQYAFTVGRADAGGYGYGLQILSATQAYCKFGSASYPISVPSTTWTHIAFTKSGTSIKIYVNGSIVTDTTFSSTLPTYSDGKGLGIGCFHYANGDIYGYFGYVNDFRIYDHALSAKEVKEISKALIVHYPLDGNGKGNDNLVYGSNTASIDTNAFGYSEQTGGSTRTIEYDNNIPCVKITRNSTAHSGWDYFYYSRLNTSALKTNTTYTISFDVIGSGSGTIGCSGFMNGNATNNLSNNITTITNSFNSTEWSHIKFQTTTKSSFDGLTVGAQAVYMSCAFLRTTGTWIKLKNMKVEEGSVETPWCPAPSDDLYSKLGYNSTTEYDVSGNGYNGTKSGTITQVSDTPRYNTGSYFLAGSGVFAHPNITLNQYTISFWGKHTATGKMLMGSNASPSSTNNKWYWYGDNSFKYPSGEFYYEHNAGTAADLLNKWTHFVVVYNGSNITVYRNGINEGNQSVTGAMALEYLSVGNGYSQSSYWENGYVSDFRLYATALSADDVKELYQTSASIANNGTMFGYDFNEE